MSTPIPKNVIIEIESPKTSFIYFSATFEPNPIETHLGVKLQLQVQVYSSSTDEPFNLNFIKVSFKDSSLDFQFQHDDLGSVDVKESNINGEDIKYIKHGLENQNSNQASQEENVLRLIPSNLELNWKGCTKVLETTILPYDAEFLEVNNHFIYNSIAINTLFRLLQSMDVYQMPIIKLYLSKNYLIINSLHLLNPLD